jgi:thioester reductase-like protein
MLDYAKKNLNLEAEATLDPAIEFQHPLSENSRNPKSVFLTGSTGFLGAYLLDELLEKTTANIYCLVRCSHPEAGKQRLKSNLEFYSLWKEKFSDRIIPVVGDLSQPMLGLSQKQFSQLAEKLDVIYHNGALVNSFYPYSTLKATNVKGTEEIIRLASTTQTKAVHFVSTVAVFFSQAHSPDSQIKETDNLVLNSLKGGYKQSKAVAESLINIAKERGMPACIYRVSRITGHSKTGISGNLKDFLWAVVKICIELGKFPDVENLQNMVTVDYVSQAIVHLSMEEKSYGKAFHLLNPQPTTWKQLMKNIGDLGYKMEEISTEKWLLVLKKYAANSSHQELSFFSRMLGSSQINLFAQKPQFDASNAIAALTSTSINCHPLDTELLKTYFSYFQKIGYMPIS